MTASNRDSEVFCNAEWHLRAYPYAIGIYALAMHLTKGGERDFYLSQPQVVSFYGWNIKTVKKAFKVVRAAGLFELRKNGVGGTGKGNFASVYHVVKHSELKPGKCRQESTGPSEGAGPYCSTDRPIIGRPTGPRDGPLVSDVVSVKLPNPTLASDSHRSTASQKSNVNPIPIPEDFCADESNQRFARQHGLNLEEEVAAFYDLHGAIGNERRNWQSVFRNHLEHVVFG